MKSSSTIMWESNTTLKKMGVNAASAVTVQCDQRRSFRSFSYTNNRRLKTSYSLCIGIISCISLLSALSSNNEGSAFAFVLSTTKSKRIGLGESIFVRRNNCISGNSKVRSRLTIKENHRTRGRFYETSRQPSLLQHQSSNNDEQEKEAASPPSSSYTTTATMKDGETDGSKSLSSESKSLNEYLSSNDLKGAINLLKNNPTIDITREQFKGIFDTIEYTTSQEDENIPPQTDTVMLAYPPTSKSRSQMTQMYNTLQHIGCLKVFGACESNNFPASGQKIVTPQLLEDVSNLSMDSLTPKGSGNTFLWAGLGLAIIEGLISLKLGIDFNYLVFGTIALALIDRIALNGASVEFLTKLLYPEYQSRITKHEAGHFLLAYLLGCPVEGCVLSPLAAKNDVRFRGVSAGTSFFDEPLSKQVNGMEPLQRSSIDRFSIIVMGGIAAEALEFNRADGGAGDEQSLIMFLSQINPRGGGAVSFAGNSERIRNQARWAALQAVLLLRRYKPAYDALVDALERGGNLGDCIYAIEQSSRQYNLKPLKHPDGYIVDRNQQLEGSPYADLEWIPYNDEDDKQQQEASLQSSSVLVNNKSNSTPSSNSSTSAEQFLHEYRQKMEERLKELNSSIEE